MTRYRLSKPGEDAALGRMPLGFLVAGVVLLLGVVAWTS